MRLCRQRAIYNIQSDFGGTIRSRRMNCSIVSSRERGRRIAQSKIHIHMWQTRFPTGNVPIGNFYERSPRDFSLVRPFTSAVCQSARENCRGNAPGVFS